MRVGRQVEGEEGYNDDKEGGQVESSKVEKKAPFEEDVHQQTGVALKELRASPGVPESGDAGQENGAVELKTQLVICPPGVSKGKVGV